MLSRPSAVHSTNRICATSGLCCLHQQFFKHKSGGRWEEANLGRG